MEGRAISVKNLKNVLKASYGKNKKKEKSAPVESPVDELLNQLSKKTREAEVLNNLMNTLRGQVSKLQIERDDLSNKLSEFEKQIARAQSIPG